MTYTDDAFATLLKRLSVRAYNALQREGWCDAARMRKVNQYDLIDIRSFGVNSLAAVVVALNETQGAQAPEWVINFCIDHAESSWWAPEYAAMREKLAALKVDQPRLAVLQSAVIEAAKTWRQDGKWDDVPLEEAIEALQRFESGAER